MLKKSPFDNNYFIGYVSHVSPQFVKVHFPSSTLLNKTIFSGEEFNGVCGKINVHTIAAQKYTTPQAA